MEWILLEPSISNKWANNFCPLATLRYYRNGIVLHNSKSSSMECLWRQVKVAMSIGQIWTWITESLNCWIARKLELNLRRSINSVTLYVNHMQFLFWSSWSRVQDKSVVKRVIKSIMKCYRPRRVYSWFTGHKYCHVCF